MLRSRAQVTADVVRAHRIFGIPRRPRRKLPRQIPPLSIEREYARAVQDLVVPRIRAALARLYAELPQLLAGAAAERKHDSARRDAGESKRVRQLIEAARQQIRDSISTADIENLAREFARRTSTYQRTQLSRQTTAALGVDVLASDRKLGPIVSNFVDANVSLIRDIGEKTATRVELAVTNAVQTGELHGDLAEDLRVIGFGEERAALIARDQVGKLYGQVNASRQEELGVNKFIWRTVGDERVRDEHEELDGEEFSYAEGGHPTEGLPGEPILCRCWAEPVFDDVIDMSEDVPEDVAAPSDREAREADRRVAAAEARAEAERQAREEAERAAAAEAERAQQEAAERAVIAEHERLAREAAEMAARAEQERIARELQEAQARAEAERLAREEADRAAAAEAERAAVANVELDAARKEHAFQLSEVAAGMTDQLTEFQDTGTEISSAAYERAAKAHDAAAKAFGAEDGAVHAQAAARYRELATLIEPGAPVSLPEFERQRKAYSAQLTDPQTRAALKYSGHAYEEINNKLRAGKRHEVTKELDAAIKTAPAPSRIEVYRGVSISAGTPFHALITGLRPGDTFADKAYVSTTSNRDKAFGGGTAFTITVPKKMKAAPIPSHHDGEVEYLLPRGSTFRVTRVVVQGRQREIFMTVVAPEKKKR